MDGGRFDALARALVGSGSRRAALGGLLGGALALLGAGGEEAAAHDPSRRCREIRDVRKRKACLAKATRHTRQHRGGGGGGACPEGALARCLEPAVAAFLAAAAPCAPACEADPEGAACRSCLGPPAEAAVAAARACAEAVCGGGGVAAAAPGCDLAQLTKCTNRNTRNAVFAVGGAAAGCGSTFGVGCAGAIAFALAGVAASYADCDEDFGCPAGQHCLRGDVCCPDDAPEVCADGTCCRVGRRCREGSCQRDCPPLEEPCGDACCSGGYFCCGDTCCPTGPGWLCRGNSCELDCGPTGCGG
jgi:hypothetical protein